MNHPGLDLTTKRRQRTEIRQERTDSGRKKRSCTIVELKRVRYAK
jgi:hypothetical protein